MKDIISVKDDPKKNIVSKRRDIIRVFLLLVTLAWMLFIFNMSSTPADRSYSQSNKTTTVIFSIIIPHFDEMNPDEQSKYIEAAHRPVRKCAHFIEFAILGALLCEDLILWTKMDRKTILILAIVIGICYAASDELHQLFVPERDGKITDLLIDSAGVITGVFFVSRQRTKCIRDRE